MTSPIDPVSLTHLKGKEGTTHKGLHSRQKVGDSQSSVLAQDLLVCEIPANSVVSQSEQVDVRMLAVITLHDGC